jgi:hypothetical protein
MTKFEFILIAVVAVGFVVVWFVIYCLCNYNKTKKELKSEGSTFKDKNFKWEMGHLHPFNKKPDTLVKYFIDNPYKIKIYDDCNIAFYKNGKVLLVWTENKYYAYANHIYLCKSDSIDDILYPMLRYEDERPSYKTMKRIAEIEDAIKCIGNYSAVKNDI